MSEKKVLNPTYKNGVKTLTETQIKNGLPGYDLLKKKIEIIRENSADAENWSDDGLFENLKYDNIFSILGGRGAGKTSILFTLYHYLKSDDSQKNKINILMPLIMPELIDNSDNFIGWILAAVEKNLDGLETELKKRGYSDGNKDYADMCQEYKFFERCIFNDRNKLRKTFEELKKAYYSKIYNSRRGEWDYTSDLELVSNINSKGFELIQKFTKYWDKLVKVYKNLYENKKNESPLIFFMIDDADLKPQIINELVFGLPKFFSHPNVIVIISASQKILNFTVKNFMYEQITKKEFDLTALMNIEYQYNYKKYLEDEESLADSKIIKFHDLRYGREYDKIKNLTDEILRKLFPVCNRFYLKKYDRYEEKCALKFEVGEKKTVDISEQFASKLREFKKSILNRHYNSIEGGADSDKLIDILNAKAKNFSLLIRTEPSKSDKEPYFLSSYKRDFKEMRSPFYLSFLGKYPRDIVSGYYAFSDMLDELDTILAKFYKKNKSYHIGDSIDESFISEIYDTCMSFINSIITSNRHLKPFCRRSADLIFKRKLHWQLFVNYAMVLDILRDPKYLGENKANPDNFVEMICLLNFVEQLIVLVFPNRMASHGYVEFCQVLKECNIKIVKPSDDLDSMFRQYSRFQSLNILLNFDKTRFEHQEIFLDTVYGLKLLGDNNYFPDELENRKWYELLYEVMFYRFSNKLIIRRHKRKIFIIGVHGLANPECDQIFDFYYDRLKEWFSEDDPKATDMDAGAADQVIIQMNTLLLSLDEELDRLYLRFRYPKKDKESHETVLEEFAKELENNYASFKLRIEFNKFVQSFSKGYKRIRRHYLLQNLKRIESIIYRDDETNVYAGSIHWLRRFENHIKDSFIAPVEDEHLKKCREFCADIKNISTKYIRAITARYFYDSDQESHLKGVEEMRKRYRALLNIDHIKQFINGLREQEWQNGLEEE